MLLIVWKGLLSLFQYDDDDEDDELVKKLVNYKHKACDSSKKLIKGQHDYDLS